ncbi:hypothetical protein NPIL_132491 [Nephila pilipes]|uniref:Uncharacterized protein n=1 Tax=Nephila pilipes TaxID=299642 RepID=A0A8X6TZY2_NEPPI|nr:hypothetical protein NPIL_132491 [Nephila pilipes]
MARWNCLRDSRTEPGIWKMVPWCCLRDSFLSLVPGLISTDCKTLGIRKSACLVKTTKDFEVLVHEIKNLVSLELGAIIRVKGNSIFSQVLTTNIISGAREQQHLIQQCSDPSKGLIHVFFHNDLPVKVNK